MSSIRDLKKMINYELSGVIEECYLWQLTNEQDSDKAETIIDAAINKFDALISLINDKSVSNRKTHLQSVTKDLHESSAKFMKDIAAL